MEEEPVQKRHYSSQGRETIATVGAMAGATLGGAMAICGELIDADKYETAIFHMLSVFPDMHGLAQVDTHQDMAVRFVAASVTILVPVLTLAKAGLAAGLGAYQVYGDKATAVVITACDKFLKTEPGALLMRANAVLADVAVTIVAPKDGILGSIRHAQSMRETNYRDASGVEFRGKTTTAFRQAMCEAYTAIPEPIRNYMFEEEWLSTVGSSTAFEAHRGFTDCEMTQRLTNEGWHCNVSGWYTHGRRQIIVNEHYLRSVRPGAMNHAVDTMGILTHLWEAQSPHFVKQVLWHEYGHAIDGIFEFSRSPSFRRQFESDLAAMGGVDGGVVKGYGYYMNQPEAYRSHEETFAELFAHIMYERATVQGTPMLNDFPATSQWIRYYVGELERCCAIGPQAVEELKAGFAAPHPVTVRGDDPITEPSTRIALNAG